MAAPATYVSMVRGLTKSTTGITSNQEVVNFLNAGVIFLMNSIPKELLKFLAVDSTNIVTNGAAGYDHATDRIVEVRRSGIACDEIPAELAYIHSTLITGNSLHKGSVLFPKYYQRGGKIYIVPDPTTVQPGVVSFIETVQISSATIVTTMVEIENPIILYAAAMDSMALANYYSKSSLDASHETTGDVRDALDKARDLIDASTLLSQGEDAEFWLQSEDPEIIASVVGMAQQEVNRALAELRDMEATQGMTAQYLEKSAQLFDRAYAEVEKYVANNSRMIGLNIASQRAENRPETG